MRQKRMYGLFRLINDNGMRKRWERVYPSLAYPIGTARRVFQTTLIFGSQGRRCCLKPAVSL